MTSAERGPGTRLRVESAELSDAELGGLPGGSMAAGQSAAFVREEHAGYDADPAGGEAAVPDLQTVRVSLPEA